MRKAYKIDEAEYKLAGKKGAHVLINRSMLPFASDVEVVEIDGEYWLSYDFDEIGYRKKNEPSYKNGWSHTIV